MSAPYTALVSALCTRRIGQLLDNNNEQEPLGWERGPPNAPPTFEVLIFARSVYLDKSIRIEKVLQWRGGGTGNGTGEGTEKNGATKNRDLFSERTEFVGPLKARPATSREGHDCVADRKEWRGEGRRPKGGCAGAVHLLCPSYK